VDTLPVTLFEFDTNGVYTCVGGRYVGMFGVDEFEGIINPPEAGLLAVGTVQEQPVARDGRVTIRPRMRVTLSCDHRAFSGDVGARFLQAFGTLLQEPLRLGF